MLIRAKLICMVIIKIIIKEEAFPDGRETWNEAQFLGNQDLYSA